MCISGAVCRGCVHASGCVGVCMHAGGCGGVYVHTWGLCEEYVYACIGLCGVCMQ